MFSCCHFQYCADIYLRIEASLQRVCFHFVIVNCSRSNCKSTGDADHVSEANCGSTAAVCGQPVQRLVVCGGCVVQYEQISAAQLNNVSGQVKKANSEDYGRLAGAECGALSLFTVRIRSSGGTASN